MPATLERPPKEFIIDEQLEDISYDEAVDLWVDEKISYDQLLPKVPAPEIQSLFSRIWRLVKMEF